MYERNNLDNRNNENHTNFGSLRAGRKSVEESKLRRSARLHQPKGQGLAWGWVRVELGLG